ncbi:MAG: YbhB/YbcL family Raf kinase inhibitor-like protein [Lachnospiraceae bacterium]|jgi:Raf kinase inhibitor-like YbhB/YbcL family protein|nr:YbhB/YbcL family Raf kinase inhibitor-like protein [Lachnospiraceae bacterium]MCI9135491.1 YbhB/YbcL family Raf kinase inhibitor-like protein [Lachnospiraceae bacterium]
MEQGLLEFQCKGFHDNKKFRIQHTGRGEDLSPEFVIKNLSPQAVTLVITLEDLSHPINRFTHWVIWNIPATDKIKQAIPSGKILSSPEGAVQGIGYGLHRYAGPKPPRGKSHTYCFTIYALDCKLSLKPWATKRKVLSRARGHIVQQGEVVGDFE